MTLLEVNMSNLNYYAHLNLILIKKKIYITIEQQSSTSEIQSQNMGCQ